MREFVFQPDLEVESVRIRIIAASKVERDGAVDAVGEEYCGRHYRVENAEYKIGT